jgi:hypothetical protein
MDISIRRLGSAALDLYRTVPGRLDFVLEYGNLSIYEKEILAMGGLNYYDMLKEL